MSSVFASVSYWYSLLRGTIGFEMTDGRLAILSNSMRIREGLRRAEDVEYGVELRHVRVVGPVAGVAVCYRMVDNRRPVNEDLVVLVVLVLRFVVEVGVGKAARRTRTGKMRNDEVDIAFAVDGHHWRRGRI